MIVVEGPDGSGKTTLCEWICTEFGLEMGKRSTPNRDEIYKTTRADTWRAVQHELRCAVPGGEVWDRMGPYSDPIYSAVGIPNERKCAFTVSEIHCFDLITSMLGLVILCLPPLDVVMENVRKEHQLDGVAKNTQSIYRHYRSTMGHCYRYIYTQRGSLASTAILINRYLDKRKERECLSSSTPATLGLDPRPAEGS